LPLQNSPGGLFVGSFFQLQVSVPFLTSSTRPFRSSSFRACHYSALPISKLSFPGAFFFPVGSQLPIKTFGVVALFSLSLSFSRAPIVFFFPNITPRWRRPASAFPFFYFLLNHESSPHNFNATSKFFFFFQCPLLLSVDPNHARVVLDRRFNCTFLIFLSVCCFFFSERQMMRFVGLPSDPPFPPSCAVHVILFHLSLVQFAFLRDLLTGAPHSPSPVQIPSATFPRPGSAFFVSAFCLITRSQLILTVN